jgi:hypothetical protein
MKKGKRFGNLKKKREFGGKRKHVMLMPLLFIIEFVSMEISKKFC